MQQTGSLDEACLKARAARFAWRIIRLAERLPMTGAAGLCGDELLLSAGLIRTNCETALQAVFDDEFRRKLEVVQEEAHDCQAWLELLAAVGGMEQPKLDELMAEADELTAIVAGTVRSTRGDNGAELGRQDCEAPYLRLRR